MLLHGLDADVELLGDFAVFSPVSRLNRKTRRHCSESCDTPSSISCRSCERSNSSSQRSATRRRTYPSSVSSPQVPSPCDLRLRRESMLRFRTAVIKRAAPDARSRSPHVAPTASGRRPARYLRRVCGRGPVGKPGHTTYRNVPEKIAENRPSKHPGSPSFQVRGIRTTSVIRIRFKYSDFPNNPQHPKDCVSMTSQFRFGTFHSFKTQQDAPCGLSTPKTPLRHSSASKSPGRGEI